MAIHETFTCQNCGFEFTDSDEYFFYNQDSHEIVEFVHLFSTVGISDGSKIKGTVIESYCSHCNKFIKTFYINTVDCPQYNSEQIIDIVKSGIKNSLKKIKNETMSRVKELNEIKSRKRYKIEKKRGSFPQDALEYLTELTEEEQNKFLEDRLDIYVSFVELEGCYYRVCIQNFDSEKEAIEYCKRHAFENFFDEIDREISWNRNFLKRKLKYLYRVEYWDSEEYSNITTINCPKCGNEVYKFINENYPCPNCEGKLIITNTTYAD